MGLDDFGIAGVLLCHLPELVGLDLLPGDLFVIAFGGGFLLVIIGLGVFDSFLIGLGCFLRQLHLGSTYGLGISQFYLGQIFPSFYGFIPAALAVAGIFPGLFLGAALAGFDSFVPQLLHVGIDGGKLGF